MRTNGLYIHSYAFSHINKTAPPHYKSCYKMHLMLHAAQRKQIAVSFFHKIEDKASLSKGKWCALVTVGTY